MKIKPAKYYLISALVVFMAGLMQTVAAYLHKDYTQILLLGLVATGIATVISMVFNFAYFLPFKSTTIRFVLPGILNVLLVFVIWHQEYDAVFFGILGLTNLGMGVLWFYKIRVASTVG